LPTVPATASSGPLRRRQSSQANRRNAPYIAISSQCQANSTKKGLWSSVHRVALSRHLRVSSHVSEGVVKKEGFITLDLSCMEWWGI
jgi:hypothetical protein